MESFRVTVAEGLGVAVAGSFSITVVGGVGEVMTAAESARDDGG